LDPLLPEDELLLDEEMLMNPLPGDMMGGMPPGMPPDPGMVMGDPMAGIPVAAPEPLMGPIPEPVDPWSSPALMMGPTMSDPLTGAPLPDPLGLAQPILEDPVEDEAYGPTPPPWYRKPAKPKVSDVLEDAERERERHELRVQLAMETISRLNLEGAGHFERDKEKVKTGEIEIWVDTSIRDEHDSAVAHIAMMDWSAESPYRSVIDQEEADAKEDLIHYVWECWMRQHARAGNAHLKIALPDILMKYGMLVAMASVDPGDEEVGIRMRLLDPATCFPVHEGHRGLGAMYRIYTASAAQVIGDFGDPDGRVERKVKKIVGQSEGNDGTFDRGWEGEVIEYWDRNWVLIAFEGEQILVREHGYAMCPFVVTYGGFGQQAFTNTRDVYVSGEGETWNRPGFGVSGFQPKQDDMGRISQPFWSRRFRQHDLGEAVGGRLLTALRRSIKPPVMIKQTLMSGEMNDVELDWDEEGQTKIGADDDILPMPTTPTPEILAPVMEMLAQGKATSMASGIMMGQSPHSQASGSAIDILSQSGYTRWSAVVLGCQTFMTEFSELILCLYRDWGLLLGMEPNIGTLYVPRRNPNPRVGGAPVHEVTPDLLRRVGIRLEVKFYKFNPASLASLAQGLAVLKSMGIMPKLDAIKIAAFSADPQGVLRRVDEEALSDVPEVKQEQTLSRLVREAEEARNRGDMASHEERLGKAIFIAGMMQRRQMIGQPGAGGAGMPPGMPPTIPGIPPMDLGRDPSTGQPSPLPEPGTAPQYAIPEMAVQGLSMPEMGVPVGTSGGRPQGS
jgi:hypothetical protein